MQLHSMVVSEPVGLLSGFGVGMITFHVLAFAGVNPHTSLMIGCLAHFVTNSVVAGKINLMLLDFLALVARLPLAAGSALWMNHFVSSGHLLW